MKTSLIRSVESELDEIGEPGGGYRQARRMILQRFAIRILERLENHKKGLEPLDLRRELEYEEDEWYGSKD